MRVKVSCILETLAVFAKNFLYTRNSCIIFYFGIHAGGSSFLIFRRLIMQNVMQMPQTYAIIYKYNRLLTSRNRGNYYEDIKNIMLYGSRLPHSLQPERLQSAKG